MRITSRQLRRIIKEELQHLWEQTKNLVCPAPTQDLELNTKNRDEAIRAKHIQYGPLNLSDDEYWSRVAEHWNTTTDVAKDSRCANCAAFDLSPRMSDCMPGLIMTREEIELAIKNNEPWETLGYCWMHSFKCHSARVCYTWAAGGPISENDISQSWQQRSDEKESKET